MTSAPDLATLIADRKGGRSYERLARDCGRTVTSARLQQMAKGQLAGFSTPKVIEGLARGLNATVTEVVAAMARSLGLDVRYGGDPNALVIGEAGRLPAAAREAVIAVALQLVEAYRVHDNTEEVGRDGNAAATSPAEESSAQYRSVTLEMGDGPIDPEEDPPPARERPGAARQAAPDPAERPDR
jgi:hypothetical protein